MLKTKSLRLYFFIIILLGVFVFTPKVFASTPVDTDITGDTTWNLAGSPYIVSVPINVAAGVTLTVEPGTIVKFKALASGSNFAALSIHGKIIAEGTAEDKIYFTSLWDDSIGGDTNGDGNATIPDPYTFYGDWRGINFISAEGQQSFKNVVISHALIGLSFNNSIAMIEGLETNSNMSDLEASNGSSVSVSGLISENAFGSVYNDASTLILSNSIIENSLSNVGGGVNLSNGSHTTIQNTKIFHYNKAGIYDNGGNTVNISNSEISNNYYYGIFVANNTSANPSQYIVNNVTIKNNTRYGAYNQATYALDLRNVYWGSSLGTHRSVGPNDLGNVVSSNVLFDPWLTTDPIIKPTPVLIIPGVLGTDIKKGIDKLWLDLVHNLTDIGDTFMDPLQFNTNLTPLDMSLTIGDVVKKATIAFFSFDYTNGLIQEFKNQGYTEGISSNATLFTFPYDWRYGVSGIVDTNTGKTTADLLKEKIDQIRTQTGSDKVDVIAHSTGGLLVKKYVMDHSTDNHIGKAVFVGVPNTGAPKAIKAFIQGDNFGNPLLADSEMKKIAKNLPVAYDLSPSQQYFNTKGSYVKIIEQPIFAHPIQDLNFDQANSFLIDDQQLNSQALTNAHNLHTASFDNYDMRTAGVDLYAVDGCKAGTIGKIVEVRQDPAFNDPASPYYNPDPTPSYQLEYTPGDGTVPLESSTNLPINEANKYYALKSEHGKMLSQASIRQEIVNIVSGGSLNVDSNIITQDIAKCKLNGKAISVFSPLDIDVVDQSGNHSGLSSDGVSIENNIPNADFEIMGEHKFVYLPNDEGQTYTINIKGTGAGTFTLKEDEISNNYIKQTQIFSDIPVTASLTGQVNLDINSPTTTLSLDTNGDGTIDQTIQPTSIIKDVTSPEFSVQFNLAAKDLQFTGIDNISTPGSIKVIDNDNLVTLIDEAGNTSQMTLKDRNRRSAMVAEIQSLVYNNQTANLGSNTLKFSWSYDKAGQLSSLKQIVKSRSNFSISATYNGSSTQITGQDQTGKISKTLTGLVLLKVFTKMGDLSWSY